MLVLEPTPNCACSQHHQCHCSHSCQQVLHPSCIVSATVVNALRAAGPLAPASTPLPLTSVHPPGAAATAAPGICKRGQIPSSPHYEML